MSFAWMQLHLNQAFLNRVIELIANFKSMEFDGVNQWVEQNDNQADVWDATGAYTVMVRAKDTERASNRIFGIRGTTSQIFDLYYSGSTLTLTTRGTSGNNTLSYTVPNDRLNEFNTIHLTKNAASNDFKMYFNGSEVDSGIRGFDVNIAVQMGIGAREGGLNNLEGYIDMIGVFEAELTVAEIRESVTTRDLTAHSRYDTMAFWYDFEDSEISGSTITDKTGNGNNATINNSAVNSDHVAYPYSYQLSTELETLLNSFGEYINAPLFQAFGGFAWDFDGVNDFIILDNDWASLTSSTTWTYLMWIKTESATDDRFFGHAYGGVNFAFLQTSSGAVRYAARDGSNIVSITGSKIVNDNQWHLVALAKSSTQYKLYVDDGVDQTINDSDVVPVDTIGIGGADNGFGAPSGNTFNGQMADVLIFDTELTASQIEEIYNNHQPRDENQYNLTGNLIGYYRPYNSRIGSSNVVDQSNSSNNGTMTNMTEDDIVLSYPRTTVSLQSGDEGSFSFNGTNQYASVSDDSSLSFAGSSFSFSTFIKMDDATNFPILFKEDEYLFHVNSSDQLELILYDDSATATKGRYYSTALTSFEGQWINVGFSWDGTDIKLYLNSEQVDDTDNNSGSFVDMEDLSNDLQIGREGSNYANGSVSISALDNSAWTLESFQEFFNDGSPIDVSSAVTFSANNFWKFDGSDVAPTIADNIGNIDLTLQNSPTFDNENYPTN